MNTLPYLVYGATGAQGRAVADALLAEGERVRALVRDPAASVFAGDPRLELAEGDFERPESLLAASRGVAGIYLMLPLQFDRETALRWGKAAIDAAVAAKAPLLVFNTGIFGMPQARATGSVAIDIKTELADYLRRAAIPSIVLHASIYLDNLTAPFAAQAIVGEGVLAYPIPADRKVSWISWKEAAAYAVAALKRPDLGAARRSFQIGGAQAVSGPELVEALAGAVGRPVSYLPLTIEQFRAGLTAAFGDLAGNALADLYRYLTDPEQRGLLEVDLDPVRAELVVAQESPAQWAQRMPWQKLAGG